MVDSQSVPLVCPICKGTEFKSAPEGLVLKKMVFTCQACGTRIRESGHGDTPYEIIQVSPDYSNCHPLFDGLRWSRQELGEMSLPVFSDSTLSEWVQGSLPADILEDSGEMVPFRRHRDEKVILALENVISFTDRSWTNPKGTSFSYRQHAGKWHQAGKISIPRRQAVIESLDRGILVLTTQRYVYKGEQRQVDESLTRIANVFPYLDGMGLARANAPSQEFYRGTYHWPYVVAIWRGLIKLAHASEDSSGT